MKAADLLEEVRAEKILLWLDGDALRYRCAGGLPGPLKDRIAGLRPELVSHLKREQEATAHPLSNLQQAYWLGEQSVFRFAAPALVHLVYRCDAIDGERLRAALAAVMQAHPPLRCRISDHGVPVPMEAAPPPLTEMDAPVEGSADSCGAIDAAALLPAMDCGPLFAVALVRGEEGAALHLVLRLIAFDAPAVGILLADLAEAYADPQLFPRTPRGVYDELRWPLQKRPVSPMRREQARVFWKARIASLPPPPQLPVVSSAGVAAFRRRHGQLDPVAWQALCRRAAAQNLSINAVLACVYADALRRWSETSRFSLNVMVSGRLAAPEAAGRIGNYAGTLLLDCGSGGGTFAQRGAALQDMLVPALAHMDFDGVDALRNVLSGQPERAAMPVAPYVFSTQIGAPPPPVLHPALPLSPTASAMSTPQVWLDHQVYEVDGTLCFNFDAVDGLFPTGLIDQLFDYYRAVLRSLATDPDAWSADSVPPLPPSCMEARCRANATQRLITPRVLHEGLWTQAERTPQAPFLLTTEETLTYGETVAAVERLAGGLRAAGVRPGDRVLVQGRKTPQTVVALFAIMACGAAYVPAAPSTPVERLLRIARHAAVRLVCGDDAENLSRLAADGLCVLDIATAIAEGPASRGSGPARPDDVAYVIYTSGSTGTPKGVVISHRAAWNTIEDVNRRTGLTAQDRLFAISEFSFDLSVYDLFGAAAVGAAVVLPPTTAHPDPAAWLKLAARHGVTVWNSVPAILDMAVAELEADGSAPRPEALRQAMVSGDWVPLTLLPRLRAQVPGCQLMALGGATEASIWSNWFAVEAVDPAWSSVPYGWPLANQSFHVLDDHGRHRPPMVAGHLHICGEGLAQGYLGEPERTAAAFHDALELGERAYATGDMGRYLPDGSLEFLGRRDLQVKIHGHRVELGEVEKTLEDDPLVARAVALVDRRKEAQLLMAVILWRGGASGGEMARMALLERARRTLPPYMVPARLVDGIDLPLNANGKVDRTALAARVAAEWDRSAAEDATVVWTADERRVADVWAQILPAPPPSPTMDFFAAGGDSLRALQLTHELKRVFGTALRLEEIYHAPTVRALAEKVVRQAPQETDFPCLAPGRPGGGVVLLFHPVGGSVFCYGPLTQLLPPGAKVVAVPAKTEVPGALHVLAADYAAAIRRAAPERPLVLAGWSLGGMLALEVARRLEASGVDVDHVFAIDPWTAADEAVNPSDGALALAFVGDLEGAKPGGESPPGSGADVADVFAWGRATGLVPAAVPDEALHQRFALFASLYRALLRHDVIMPQARTTIYRATDQERPLVGLVPLTEAVLLPSVPLVGDHYAVMRRPQLDRIADDIAAALKNAGP